VNHAVQNQENLQVQETSEQEKSVIIGFISCFACCVCTPFIFFFIIFILRESGALDGSNGPYGPRYGPGGPGGPGQYNLATTFVDQGSIDGLILGICDGNFIYNVTTSGIIEYAQTFKL